MLALEQPLPSYWRDDVPAFDLVTTVVDSDGAPIDLDVFDSATATVADPDGVVVGTLDATLADDELTLPLTALPALVAPGVYRVAVDLVLEGVEGNPDRVQSVSPAPFVVEEVDGWTSLADARIQSRDFAAVPDWVLYDLLSAARGQVELFAPVLPADEPVPANYRRGQVMQTRTLFNSNGIDPTSNSFGTDQFTVTVFPLDWMVKQVLRPRRGIPNVG